MEQFTGVVVIKSASGSTTIRLDGESSKLTVKEGVGVLENPVPGTAALAEAPPSIVDQITIDGATETITAGHITIDGAAGTIAVNGADGAPLVTLDTSEGRGQIVVCDGEGREVLRFTAGNAQLTVGAANHGGALVVRDEAGRDTLSFDSSSSRLFVGAAGNDGDLVVRDAVGREALKFDGENAQLFVGADGVEGDIIVRNDNGDDVIHLNGSNGDIILSNGDAAEDFELAAGADATPGTVMVLAGDGTVQPCAGGYDRKVIGVVAGAGAYRPAIVLDRRPDARARRVSISVMGKVACRADAAYGAIEVGDLLTSSPTAGTAMRASDMSQAFGAVIGKALTPLREGTDLVDMVIGFH